MDPEGRKGGEDKNGKTTKDTPVSLFGHYTSKTATVCVIVSVKIGTCTVQVLDVWPTDSYRLRLRRLCVVPSTGTRDAENRRHTPFPVLLYPHLPERHIRAYGNYTVYMPAYGLQSGQSVYAHFTAFTITQLSGFKSKRQNKVNR